MVAGMEKVSVNPPALSCVQSKNIIKDWLEMQSEKGWNFEDRRFTDRKMYFFSNEHMIS